MLSGVTRRTELESGVRFSPMRMVASQPIHPDFIESGFSGGFPEVRNLNLRSI